MLDIPNYVTFPFEIGVGILILWLDKSQRKREEVQIRNRHQKEEKDRKRFNNFMRESNKLQLMFLESILETLDQSKTEQFKDNVSKKFSAELNQDLSELQELVDKRTTRSEETGPGDPEIEDDIQSKIDEIDMSKDFAKTFLSNDIFSSINNISDLSKKFIDDTKDASGRISVHMMKEPTPEMMKHQKEIGIEIKNLTESIEKQVEELFTKKVGKAIVNTKQFTDNIMKTIEKARELKQGKKLEEKKAEEKDP